MTTVDVVYGLVTDDEAEAAVEDLTSHGIHAEEIEVQPAAPGRYLMQDEYLHEDAAGARRGAYWGFALGAIVGLIAALMTATIRDAGIGMWLITAAGFGGLAALIGGMTGLQVHDHPDDDPLRWFEAGQGQRMVAVHCNHYGYRAHRILERHQAVFVETAHPTG